jgi:hypothetical protein
MIPDKSTTRTIGAWSDALGQATGCVARQLL